MKSLALRALTNNPKSNKKFQFSVEEVIPIPGRMREAGVSQGLSVGSDGWLLGAGESLNVG